MVATKVNLVIESGATFEMTLDLLDSNNQPIAVAGYTAAAQMRQHALSRTAYDFDTNLADGQLILSMSANATALIPPGYYMYDGFLYGSTTTIKIVEGIATVVPEITK